MNDDNNDGLAQSTSAHEQFHELVQQIEAQPSTTSVEPNQADLEWLNNQQSSTKDDSGRRRYETDSIFREKLEAARTRVVSGESIADVRSATDRALNGELRPSPSQEPLEPQGSPSERLAQHLEYGGTIAQGDVNEGTWDALTAGYEVRLPEGYVLAGEHVEMLHNARNAGVSQDVVSRYIREALKD